VNTAAFRVFVTRLIPEAGITLLKNAGFHVEVNEEPDRVIPKQELIERVKDKEALLSLLTDRIDEEVIGAAPKLKVVANYAVGFDNIDIQAATKRGIVVTNTPEVLTETVAEHTIALMISISRRIVESDKFTRAGRYKGWDPLLFLGQDLKGKTLGIIGLGRIGKAVAQRAVKGMDMRVIYHKRRRDEAFEKEFNAKMVDFETLLKESDFISIHVPLTPDTKYLISFEEFDLMKETAYLINTARGPIVEEKALVEALDRGRIAGAALDVFECEPEITCNRDASPQLKDFDNVILTPHTASATIGTRSRMAEIAAQSIVDLAEGKIPGNVVNRDVIKSI
jgi:glyoxylate reductase